MDPQIIEAKKKGIGLIIVGFVAGVLACLMFWSLENSSIPSNNLSPIASTPDTSTWQTYRKEEYKYEFKHPNDWEVAITYFSSADGSQQWPSGFKIAPIGLAGTSKDFISIGGVRMVSLCEDFGLPQPTKCFGGGKENICPLTYTFSSDLNVLSTFDSLISTFKFINN